MIDTNSVETEELRLFLSADRDNAAVLPEHTVVEVFKQTSLEAIWASTSVLRGFPRQVVILRGNRYLSTVDARSPAISNRFVDRESTRAFSKWCKALEAAWEGHPGDRERDPEEEVQEGTTAVNGPGHKLCSRHRTDGTGT